MNCHEARESFSAFVDEALTADESAAVAAHLAGCADCEHELRRLRETVALLGRVVRPRAPAGFAARVLEAARPVPWPRRLMARVLLPLWPGLPVGAAAMLLVAGLAVYVFQRTPALQHAARQEEDARPAPMVQAPPPARSQGLPPSSPAEAPSRSALREAAPPPQAPPREAFRQAAPPPLAAPRPTPPAAVSPATPGPAPGIELRGRAESKAESEAAPVGRGGEVVTAKERGKTAAAPPVPPATASMPAPFSGAPKDQAVGGAAIARSPELAPAEAPAAPVSPAGEARRDSGADIAKQARGQPPTPRAAANAPAAADVGGRLTVKDRVEAENALAKLLTRIGGTLASRRTEADAIVLEIVVPRASYAEFIQGLGGIGVWLPQGEPARLPAELRITLRLAE